EQDSTGLNVVRKPQIFATTLPLGSSNTFTRLTDNPASVIFSSDIPIRPAASSTRRRMVFSIIGADLGGGNPDNFSEVFYLLSPLVTSESSAVLSFFTGASNFPVAEATPTASPTPTPT